MLTSVACAIGPSVTMTGKEVTKQLVFDGLYSVNAKFILRV